MGRRVDAFGARFGLRYPRLTLGIVCILLGGFIAACASQLSYGTYLGAYWMICALAGIVAAAGLSVAVLISRRRHGRAASRLTVAWVLLAVVTVPAITAFPFPHDSLFPPPKHPGVEKFFNVVHGIMLGYETTAYAALLALLAYLVTRRGARWRSQQAALAGKSRAGPAASAEVSDVRTRDGLRRLGDQP